MEEEFHCKEHTFKGLALSEIGVMILGEDASFVAPHDTFKKTGINLTRDN